MGLELGYLSPPARANGCQSTWPSFLSLNMNFHNSALSTDQQIRQLTWRSDSGACQVDAGTLTQASKLRDLAVNFVVLPAALVKSNPYLLLRTC